MLNCFATLEALRERPLAPHMLDLIEGMELLAAALQPPGRALNASNSAKVTSINKRPFFRTTPGTAVQQAS